MALQHEILWTIFVCITMTPGGYCFTYEAAMYSYPVDKALLPKDYRDGTIASLSSGSTTVCAVLCLQYEDCVSAYFDVVKRTCHPRTASLHSSVLAKAVTQGEEITQLIYIDHEEWIPTTSTTSTTTSTTTTSTSTTTAPSSAALKLAVNDRVTRGPDWDWGEQDGGVGSEGTVTDVATTSPGWVKVLWDAGTENEYRNGADKKVDLAIV